MQTFFKVSHVLAFSVALCISLIASANGQSNWTAVRSGATGDLVAVYFTSDKNGWIAGDGGYLASTSDGGATWIKYPLDTKEDINEIYFRNSDNGYLVAGRVMYITHDGGKSCTCAGFRIRSSRATAIRRCAVDGLNGRSLAIMDSNSPCASAAFACASKSPT